MLWFLFKEGAEDDGLLGIEQTAVEIAQEGAAENEAILSVDKSAEGQAVAVMVRRKGSSYVTMHYHFMGSREQVEAFLLDPDHAFPMAKSVWELSASVDDQADEYPFYG